MPDNGCMFCGHLGLPFGGVFNVCPDCALVAKVNVATGADGWIKVYITVDESRLLAYMRGSWMVGITEAKAEAQIRLANIARVSI